MLYTTTISCKYGGPCDFCKIQVEFPKCPRMTFSAPARPPRENRSHYVQDSSWWSIQCVFSPAYSYSTPSYRVPRTTLGHDTSAYCTTYCKLACLVWDTKRGSMVAWLPVPGQMFSGKNLPGPWKWGPSRMVRRQGESPGVQGGLFPGGNHSCPVYWAAPVGTGSWAQAQDGRALCLPCLLCLS